jgi:uncharacterized GH25 family protein
MRLKFSVLSLMIILSAVTQAHEFWLAPEKFFFKVGEELKVNFSVGENFIGKPWDTKLARIERLDLYHLTNVTDIKQFVKEGTKDNLSVTLNEEGTHLIAMQTTNSFIELEAEKFNAYLKEDGLDEALQYREQHNQIDKPGKESYARYTKLMIQVGDKRDETFKKSAGFPLEIFIEKNPYNIKIGEIVKFRVLFKDKPLFGAKVMVWNRYDNRTTIQPVYTLKNGVIEARISSKGPWMVSVVKMMPSQDKPADWQSYWGSLVFGVE